MPIREILHLRTARLTNQHIADLALAADRAYRAAVRRGDPALAESYLRDRDDLTNQIASQSAN